VEARIVPEVVPSGMIVAVETAVQVFACS
jgi:hypothetical protein